MKLLTTILILSGQLVFANQQQEQQIEKKVLKAGQVTLEAVGQIEQNDTGYSAIREIRCLNEGASFDSIPSAKMDGHSISRAIVLFPGSKIILNRSTINDYAKRFNMKSFVQITCE